MHLLGCLSLLLLSLPHDTIAHPFAQNHRHHSWQPPVVTSTATSTVSVPQSTSSSGGGGGGGGGGNSTSNPGSAGGSIKGFTYNAQAGYDWAGQFKIASSFGFNSARFFTMLEPGQTSPLSALQIAADQGVSVLLGIWFADPATAGVDTVVNELAALKQAITIPNLKIIGLGVGNEDLYKRTSGSYGADAGTITSTITQAKAIVNGKFPVGHVDTWGQFITSDGASVAAVSDFIGYNGYPYWEKTEPQTQTLQTDFQNGLTQVSSKYPNLPIWITETGWPYTGEAQGAAVASPQNAQMYYEAVGCNMLFGKYNVWWHTLDDSILAPPHFGVTTGPGQSTSVFPSNPNLACSNSN